MTDVSLYKVKVYAVRSVGEIFKLTEEFSCPRKAPNDVKVLLYESLYPCGDAKLLLSLVELDHFLVTGEHTTLERQRTAICYTYNGAAVEVKLDGRHLNGLLS